MNFITHVTYFEFSQVREISFRHIKYKIRNMQITKACLIKTRTIHFRVKSRNRNTDLESVFPASSFKIPLFQLPSKMSKRFIQYNERVM